MNNTYNQNSVLMGIGVFILIFSLIAILTFQIHYDNSNFESFAKELLIIFGFSFSISMFLFGGGKMAIIKSNNLFLHRNFWFFKKCIPIRDIYKIEKELVNLGYTRFNIYTVYYKAMGAPRKLRLGSFTDKRKEQFIKLIFDINNEIELIGIIYKPLK